MKETMGLPESFWEQDRSIYYFQAECDDTMRVGGYYRTIGSLTLVTTPKSGHFIPKDNYPVSKAYLDDMAQHQAL